MGVLWVDVAHAPLAVSQRLLKAKRNQKTKEVLKIIRSRKLRDAAVVVVDVDTVVVVVVVDVGDVVDVVDVGDVVAVDVAGVAAVDGVVMETGMVT